MAHTVTQERPRQVDAAGAFATPTGDPFDRDVFLLRQKLLRISEKYDVSDEKGNSVLYVERPAHLFQSLGALLAAMLVAGAGWAATFTGVALLPSQAPPAIVGTLTAFGLLLPLVAAFAVGVLLAAKRHVTFYRDSGRSVKLLEILQDKKWQPITRTFSILDANGEPLAMLAKNRFYDNFRKRWYVYGPDGALAYVAKEDSVILALLRRFLGTMYGLLRTNFVILRPDGVEVVGEFNRKFTIQDRYVLDMRADSQRLVDRRVALALGVMLDTGERR